MSAPLAPITVRVRVRVRVRPAICAAWGCAPPVRGTRVGVGVRSSGRAFNKTSHLKEGKDTPLAGTLQARH